MVKSINVLGPLQTRAMRTCLVNCTGIKAETHWERLITLSVSCLKSAQVLAGYSDLISYYCSSYSDCILFCSDVDLQMFF